MASVALLYIICCLSTKARPIIYTAALFTKVSPAIAYVPVFIIFFGVGLIPKVLTASLISFFPLVLQTLERRDDMPTRLRQVGAVYAAPRWRSEFVLGIGYGLSGFSRGLLTSAPLAVVGAIVGDYVAGGTRPGGIGAYLMQASAQSNTTAIMVGVLLASTLGLVFFLSAYGIDRWVQKLLRLDMA